MGRIAARRLDANAVESHPFRIGPYIPAAFAARDNNSLTQLAPPLYNSNKPNLISQL